MNEGPLPKSVAHLGLVSPRSSLILIRGFCMTCVVLV
jgi:hypothetical protein